jgi:hypothetical protein
MLPISLLIHDTLPPPPAASAGAARSKERIVAPQSARLHALLVALFLCYSASTVNGLAFLVAPKSKCMILVGCGMTKQQAFWHSQRRIDQLGGISSSSSSSTSTLVMRDKSASYWFQAGDTVRVVENVYCMRGNQDGNTNRVNLLGRVGTVVQTWEKCTVDPTCCCAEQVNPEMAVHVQFSNSHESANQDSFTYYFSEEELVQVKEEDNSAQTIAVPSANVAPFDGMSCTGAETKRYCLF